MLSTKCLAYSSGLLLTSSYIKINPILSVYVLQSGRGFTGLPASCFLDGSFLFLSLYS